MQVPTNCIQIGTCFFILQEGYRPIILLDFLTTSIKFLTPTWTMKDDKYYQIVLMLIYNGVRKVPIADKVLDFYKSWYNDNIESEYLLHAEDGKHFLYRNYYDSYFKPLMKNLSIEKTPHCLRHTCISMLADAHVDQTTIKKIVGHSRAMTLTEKVYTHMDIGELVKAINQI